MYEQDIYRNSGRTLAFDYLPGFRPSDGGVPDEAQQFAHFGLGRIFLGCATRMTMFGLLSRPDLYKCVIEGT